MANRCKSFFCFQGCFRVKKGQKLFLEKNGPIHPSLLSDPIAYQASLRKLLALNSDILCEGHFGIYRGKEAVRSFIQSFMV